LAERLACPELICILSRFFMSSNLLTDALPLLDRARHIGILSHVRPDGDALGSSLGLGLALRAAGKTVHVWNEDGLSKLYQFLPHSPEVTPPPATLPELDLLISVDTSTADRLGKTFHSWNRPIDLNLDHHVSNTGFAKVNVIRPDLPATAALIHELLHAAKFPLSAEIAANLFVGISTDTGSFRHRGTSPATFRIAAELAEAGADVTDLSRHCYQSISRARFDLFRQVLNQAEFLADNKLCVGRLNPELLAVTGASSDDTEGLVERLLEVDSVEVSAFFETRGPDSLKVSLRSKGRINVSNLALSFGGGGHPGAAGINLTGNPSANSESVLKALLQALSP
jgi:phosphoesterase RecJ-like protein